MLLQNLRCNIYSELSKILEIFDLENKFQDIVSPYNDSYMYYMYTIGQLLGTI